MLQTARRVRLPIHIAAFSTLKSDGPVKRKFEDVKPAAPDAQIVTEPDPESSEWDSRDPTFAAMTQRVVGTIRTRPGGKQEMGDAVVTEQLRRPKPTDRHTTLQSGPDEEMVVAAGTLNVKQIGEVFLLYQVQKMDVRSIAKQYNVDAELLQRVFQHTTLVVSDQEGDFRLEDGK